MKISIKVKPKSGERKVVEIIKNKEYDIWLKSASENNKANIELIKLVSKYFKVAGCSVRIVSGKTSKKKVVEINGN